MKKTNIMMAPLFAAVVMLLSMGAVGELFTSLFVKIKNRLTSNETQSEKSTQTAVQIR